MNAFRRLLRQRKGTAAVEFAFLALPFIVLVVGSIQLFLLLLTQHLLETAAEQVGRKILTGYVQQQALTQAQFITLVCGLLPATLNCNKVIIDVSVASSFSGAVTSRPKRNFRGSPASRPRRRYASATTRACNSNSASTVTS